MADGWRVIDLTEFSGRLETQRGQLVVDGSGHCRIAIALADIAVVLLGLRASFSAAAMHQLVTHDVAVLICDWRGEPVGAAYGWSDHSRVGARHLAQATVSLPRRKNAWGRIVRAKILGQAVTLGDLGRSGSLRLRELANSVRSGDPGNAEAAAARLYWSRIFGNEDFSRHPGANDGPRNSSLDYGYAVLRSYGIRAVIGAGLAPSLGLFHHGRSNYFNLVDDLIEPFRPAIDEAVARLAQDADPTDSEVKHQLVDAAGQKFSMDGETIPTALDSLAQQLGRYVEGKAERLEVPTWVGVSGG